MNDISLMNDIHQSFRWTLYRPNSTALRRALADSITAGSLVRERKKTASERDHASRMHLYCKQLEEHFSFQNRELMVHPPPLALRQKPTWV
jgi:hypothetical protein